MGSNNINASAGRSTESFGMVANGSSGNWDVEIDETLTGEQKWFAQIEGPSLYLYFRIDGPDAVPELLQFLTDRLGEQGNPVASPHHGELKFGHFGRTPVSFGWDPEGQGRGYILVAGTGEARARLPLLREDVVHLAEALGQVCADLREERLIVDKLSPASGRLP